VSDRATSELVRAATVTLVQGEGFGATEARPEARQGFTTTSGFVQLTFKLRNETAYAVDAPGYLRTEGLVADLIAASAGRGMLRVELDPGFERRVEVRDRATRRSIPGATIASGALLSERTNEQGAAVLRADVWPATVRVEAAGYASIAWDPLAAGFPGDVIWLEPLRGDR
jgi:hypothetical protein